MGAPQSDTAPRREQLRFGFYRPFRISRNQPSPCISELAVAANQIVGRAVMTEPRLALALEFGDDARGQDLPEFDAPLIKRVDVPDRPLRKYAVLV